MGRRLISVLSFFLFCTLLYEGRAAVLNIDPHQSTFYSGDTVTLTCSIEGADPDWEYTFNKDNQQLHQYKTSPSYKFEISPIHGGQYDCVGRHKDSRETEQSNNVSLTVADKPRARLTSGIKTIPIGDTVSLSCSVGNSDGWKFHFFRRIAVNSEVVAANVGNNGVIQVSKGGSYRCSGVRESSGYVSDHSHEVDIKITFTNKIFITRQPSWSQIFEGEQIKLTCEVQGGENTEWRYSWKKDSRSLRRSNENFLQVTASLNGNYQCMARRREDLQSSTLWSEAFTVSGLHKPRATLTSETKTISVGDTVSLSCSVGNSDGWKFDFFRRQLYIWEKVATNVGNNGVIQVSKGGTYRCRGVRESSSYQSHDSNEVDIKLTFTNKVIITRQPSWSQIFQGEQIKLTCEVQGGENTEWWYRWKEQSRSLQWREENYLQVTASLNGNYQCMTRRREDFKSSTLWSEAFTVSGLPKPKALLRSNEYDLSEGSRVTLTCSVNASTGWNYFWYRDNTHSPLNISDAEVDQNQYQVSREGRYWCRGGRGNPVYYTEYSDPVSKSQGEL